MGRKCSIRPINSQPQATEWEKLFAHYYRRYRMQWMDPETLEEAVRELTRYVRTHSFNCIVSTSARQLLAHGNVGCTSLEISNFSSHNERNANSARRRAGRARVYRGSNHFHLGFIPKGRIAYAFPIAARLVNTAYLKVVVNHSVAGQYIGKQGAHLRRLQDLLQFNLTQSGRGTHGEFTGIGYPCHRANTALLFEGRLSDILMALRPLYRIIQNDMFVLDEESLKVTGGRLLNFKFELNIVVPIDLKRFLLQGGGMRCNQLRELFGIDIIAGTQNFEHGRIKETIVTLVGFEEVTEKAAEWIGVFLQSLPAVMSQDYTFMDYPRFTTAVAHSRTR